MLTPEEDFDTWSSLLVATMVPGGEFALFLPSFGRLFSCYCTAGSLPEPLADSTSTFVDVVVPSFLAALLRSSRFSYSETATIRTLLAKLVADVTTAHLAGLAPSATWLLAILNCRAEIYGSTRGAANTPQTLFSGLVSSFASRGGQLEALCAPIGSNPTFPPIAFVLKLIDGCGYHIASDVRHSLLKAWQSPLRRLLSPCNRSNLRDVSTESLSVIVEFISQNVAGTARVLDLDFIGFDVAVCRFVLSLVVPREANYRRETDRPACLPF
jgi:hypothetical protein